VDKITLDREVFKALASDTRLEILKALDVRQKTVTELAKELELNKATVFEHLEKLDAVGLIQKLDNEDRKWVYWQLTWTGRRLLHPEKITLAILLSTAGGALVTALAAAWVWLQSGAIPGGGAETADAAEPSIAMRAVEETPPAAGAALDPVWLAVAIGFGLLALALTAWAVRVRLRAKAGAATPLSP
jgi:DNA-binding transcriptional ArsR family regulator